MKNIIIAVSFMMLFSGCAVHATQIKTMTIPPHKDPVQVTMKCTGTSIDMFLIHQARADLKVKSSDGSKAIVMEDGDVDE